MKEYTVTIEVIIKADTAIEAEEKLKNEIQLFQKWYIVDTKENRV